MSRTIMDKNLLNIKYVTWFSPQLFSDTFLILRISERDMVEDVYWCSCEVSIILPRFYWNFSVLERRSKTALIQNFMKIHPVGAELFDVAQRTDRQTENANSRFSQFWWTRLKKIRLVMSCNPTTHMELSVVKTRLELNNNGDCSLSTAVLFWLWVSLY